MEPAVSGSNAPALAVTTVPAIKGNSIGTSWCGIATPAAWDWVGIYAVGSNDFAYLDWAYTNGSSSGTVNVTLNHPSIVAGNTYEARLYANDGYTLLAKTPPFTVIGATATSPAALYYYHTDHLGTPQAMTNQSGAVAWRATYDPYGQATVTVGTITNNLRFPGQYFDSETGLHYWGARYYDPKIGRGISADRRSVGRHVQEWLAKLGSARPNQPPLELNPYAYTSNNPLRWIDPTGYATVAPEYGGGSSTSSPYPSDLDIPPYVDKPLSPTEQAMLATILLPAIGPATRVGAMCLRGVEAGAVAIMRSPAARQACMALGICSATARGEIVDDVVRDFVRREQLQKASEIVRQQTTTLVK